MMLEQDIQLVRNDNRTLPFTVRNADGTPYNLANASKIWLTIKRLLSDVDPGFIQKTLAGGGIVIVDAALGKAQAVFVPGDSTAVTDTEPPMPYDVQIKDTGGIITTPVGGRVFWVFDRTLATT